MISKVLEKVVSKQLTKYLNENDLLSPNQHAYRRNHNTTTAMLQMVDNWVQGIECGQMAGVCMVDLSSAFDIVDYDLLL